MIQQLEERNASLSACYDRAEQEKAAAALTLTEEHRVMIQQLDERNASLSACYNVWIQAHEARTTVVTTAFALTSLITERKEQQEAIEKVKKANANDWQSTLEYIINMKILMEYYDELPPGYWIKRAVKEQLDVFISTLKIDCINYEATQQDSYFQLLLSKVHAMEEDERADQKAADVQKAEEKLMEFRLRIQANPLKERVEAEAAVEEAAI